MGIGEGNEASERGRMEEQRRHAGSLEREEMAEAEPREPCRWTSVRT